MSPRQVILRTLLASLALAAIAGAVGILIGGGDTLWRIAGTAAMTALAAALLLPASTAFDQAPKRPAALMAMIVVVAMYLLALALMWSDGTVLARLDAELAATLGVTFVTGSMAIFFCRLITSEAGRWAARFGLSLAAAVCVIWLAAAWTGNWRARFSSELWETGWILASYGVLASLALVGLGRDTGRIHNGLRWVGVSAAALASLLLTIHVWADTDGDPWFIVALTSTAVAVAHGNIVVRAALPTGQRRLIHATIAAVVVAGLLATLESLLHPDIDGDSFTFRLAGAAALLAACGTLALAVLARLYRRVAFEPGVTTYSHVDLACPRCQKKQAMSLGDGRCEACGLRISVKVEEPACPACGYLLYGTTTDHCPECGASVTVENSVAPVAPG